MPNCEELDMMQVVLSKSERGCGRLILYEAIELAGVPLNEADCERVV